MHFAELDHLEPSRPFRGHDVCAGYSGHIYDRTLRDQDNLTLPGAEESLSEHTGDEVLVSRGVDLHDERVGPDISGRDHLRDAGFDLLSGQGIDLDGHWLARLHKTNVLFLDRRFEPQIFIIFNLENRLARK